MARTVAELPAGVRLTDKIGLGVLAKAFPVERIHAVLRETGRASVRQRDLPAHVVVYYVILLALYTGVACREVLRCLLEGVRWLWGPEAVRVSGKSAISQARRRLGSEPLERLAEQLVGPVAVRGPGGTTRGAWYRDWRLVSLDGSTMEVPDTRENAAAFGRPGASRGRSAFPRIRFVAFVESGTHVLFGARLGGWDTPELELADEALGALGPGMLCLADRNFFSYDRWRRAAATRADLVWRVKKNARLPRLETLPDGSYLTKIYPSDPDRRHDTNAIVVRAVEYRLEGVPDSEPLYRLITTILDWRAAPAEELAALYHERWEIENALDELKTHPRGERRVLRSKRPDLVRQEFHGLILAHYAVRGLMHEAALKADEDPDRLSYVHAVRACTPVRVIRRKMATCAALPPQALADCHEEVIAEILEERVVSSRGRRNPRAIKRKLAKWPVRHRPRAGPSRAAEKTHYEIRVVK